MKRSHSIASAFALSLCLAGGGVAAAAMTHAESGPSSQTHTATSQSTKSHVHVSGSHAQPASVHPKAVSSYAKPVGANARLISQPQTSRKAMISTRAATTNVSHTHPVPHANPVPVSQTRTAKVKQTFGNHPVVSHHTQLAHPVAKAMTAKKMTATHFAPHAMQTAHHVTFVKPRTVAVRHIETFRPNTRVFGRVTAINGSRVTVRLPNGSRRTFDSVGTLPRIGSNVVAYANGERATRFDDEGRFFRTGELDRDRLVFRGPRDETQDFRIVRISHPIPHRIVFFANDEVLQSQPETVFLRSAAYDQDVVTIVEPNGALVPVAITQVQPLPGGQVMFIANDQVSPTFVPADVSFVGQVVSVVGNLVTFLLPDGSTRTLLDTGAIPSFGSEDVVFEDGQQVVGFEPAVTNFVGQVLAVDNGMTTFLLPDGTVRTLVVQGPQPFIGRRVVVYENGPVVERFVPVL